VSLVQRRTSGPLSSIMRPSFVSVMTMNTINHKDEADSSFSFEEIGSPVRIRVSVDFELTFPVVQPVTESDGTRRNLIISGPHPPPQFLEFLHHHNT
jgi:hypothetical protein